MYCDYFIFFPSKLSVQGKYQISREFGRYVQGINVFRLASLLSVSLLLLSFLSLSMVVLYACDYSCTFYNAWSIDVHVSLSILYTDI